VWSHVPVCVRMLALPIQLHLSPHFYSSKGANEGGRGKKGITVRVTVSGSTSLSWNPGRTTD
jgi:hypothetical protein